MVSGAALGGLAGGIDAAVDGRNFWHGGRLQRDIRLNMPNTTQAGQFDCNYSVAESVDRFCGNNGNAEYFRTLQPSEDGLTDYQIAKMYNKAGYSVKELSSVDEIASSMERGDPVIYNYKQWSQSGVPNGHATAVTRVRIYDNNRFLINVMNPSGSSLRFTSLNKSYIIMGVY